MSVPVPADVAAQNGRHELSGAVSGRGPERRKERKDDPADEAAPNPCYVGAEIYHFVVTNAITVWTVPL